MTTKVKIFIGVGVLAVIGVGGLVSLRSNRKPTTEVEVEKVRQRRIVAVVEASGQIEPSVSVDISSDVIGRIVAVGAEEGDVVRRGQFLIQIDPTQYQQRVERARAALESAEARTAQARANLERAELEFRRQESLLQRSLVSQSVYDEARANRDVNQANLTAAEFDVNQQRASLAELRDALEKCRIVSPMDGVVIRKNAEVGETAISGTLNNAGSLLMTIADLSSMETEVEVDETDVVDIRLGQEAEIELDAFRDRSFRGEVIRIANSSVQGQAAVGQPQQAANYKVTVRLLEMPESIRPGLSATAKITTAVQEETLGVPIQSLTVREVRPKEEDSEKAESGEEPKPGVALADSSTPDSREVPLPEGGTPATEDPEEDSEDEDDPARWEKEGVFVVRDGKAVFVPVEVGITGDKHFEVSGALEPGEEVVSGPFSAIRSLKDGDAVKVKEDKPTRTGRGKRGDTASS